MKQLKYYKSKIILFRTFISLIFIHLLVSSLNAQEVKFKVYGFYPCSKTYELIVFTLEGEKRI